MSSEEIRELGSWTGDPFHDEPVVDSCYERTELDPERTLIYNSENEDEWIASDTTIEFGGGR